MDVVGGRKYQHQLKYCNPFLWGKLGAVVAKVLRWVDTVVVFSNPPIAHPAFLLFSFFRSNKVPSACYFMMVFRGFPRTVHIFALLCILSASTSVVYASLGDHLPEFRACLSVSKERSLQTNTDSSL